MKVIKKIAIVSVYPFNDIIKGGVEGVAFNLTKALNGVTKLEIHILAPALDCAPGVEQRNELTIHWLPMPKLPGFISSWLLYRKLIFRKLESIKPDIAHFQGVAGWSLYYKKPYVLTIHGIGENDVLYSRGLFKRLRYHIVKTAENIGRRKSSDVISISPYVLTQIGTQIKGKVWNIENPISPEFFNVKRNIDLPIVLYVGRINARKNIIGLINAFVGVLKDVPTATLRLAGPADNDYLVQCRKLIARLGISENIKLLGGINRPTLLQELSQATCLALVSYQETAPMVVEEAMSAGVPVVASNICGLPYMVEHEKTGYLVNQNDTADITKRLVSILADSKKADKMSKECTAVATARFHAHSVAKKTLAVYESVLADKNVL